MRVIVIFFLYYFNYCSGVRCCFVLLFVYVEKCFFLNLWFDFVSNLIYSNKGIAC